MLDTHSDNVAPENLVTVAVIIPFFQCEHGILERAINSVFMQDYTGHIHIVVIDDSSPIPAQSELAALVPTNKPGPRSLEVIEQDNGGPAAARNAGLDHIGTAYRYAAFLDSDDTWRPAHLRRGIEQLEHGQDFYFSDYMPIIRRRSAFARDQFAPREHGEPLGDDCYHYSRDFFDQTIRNNVVGMSTVVYRVSMLDGLRFDHNFQYAGEDHLFWLRVSRQTKLIVASSNIEVDYGRGVNIFESGRALADIKTFRRIGNELRFRKALPEMFELNAKQRLRTAEIITALRHEFAINAIHALKTHPRTGLLALFDFFRQDSAAIAHFVAEILSGIKRKALSGRSSH